MEKTTSRISLTGNLVDLFKKTPGEIIDKVVYLIQGKLAPDYESLELGLAEKMAIRAIAYSSGSSVSLVEKAYQSTGDIGDAAGQIMKLRNQTTLISDTMTVERVFSTLEKISKTTGPGSQESKLRLLSSILNDTEPRESRYIMKFVMGTLRLGIADFTVMDALALAFTGSKSNRSLLENAYNVTSDLGTIARTLAKQGLESIKSLRITLFKPVRPMLAERVTTTEDALDRMDRRGLAEYKLDGERIQVHKDSKNVELFTRRLDKITHNNGREMEVSSQIKTSKTEDATINIEKSASTTHSQRNDYGDDKRIKLVPQTTMCEPSQVETFMASAIENGCEGLMIKHPRSTYRAGAREFAWVKLKRDYRSELADTLDLVVVGALYGRGRRVGKYGALLLAAYDTKADQFRSTTKVGTGFTDESLGQFFKDLEKLIISHRHSR